MLKIIICRCRRWWLKQRSLFGGHRFKQNIKRRQEARIAEIKVSKRVRNRLYIYERAGS